MDVLVVGKGMREHALVDKISKSHKVNNIYCAPGNVGTSLVEKCKNVPINITQLRKLREFSLQNNIDLCVVGPEVVFTTGIVDNFLLHNIAICGPNKATANLETSKIFAKKFMTEQGIRTPSWYVITTVTDNYYKYCKLPIVIKADGLCAGKGVKICYTDAEVKKTIHDCLIKKKFGVAGERLILEEHLVGTEVSYHILTDGNNILPLPPSQDYKQRSHGGPMTGGMGASSPVPMFNDKLEQKVLDKIVFPTIDGIKKRGMHYRGPLYFGLIIVEGEPYLLEYNVRFGDPEMQVISNDNIFDYLFETANCSLGSLGSPDTIKNLELTATDIKSICVVLAQFGYPNKIKHPGARITNLNRAKTTAKIEIYHGSTVQKIKNGRQILVTGSSGRVLSVVARDKTFGSAIERAYRTACRIHFEGRVIRWDIGLCNQTTNEGAKMWFPRGSK